jgi:hypothetical protein
MLRHTCGAAMTPVSLDRRMDRTVAGRYECSGRKAGLCEGLRVDKDAVDDTLIEYLAAVGIDVDESLRLARDAQEQQRNSTASELREAERELATLKEQARPTLDRPAEGQARRGRLGALQS